MNSPDNERPHLIGGPDCLFCNAARDGRPLVPPYEPDEFIKSLIRRSAQMRIQEAKRMGRTVRVNQLSGLDPNDEDETPGHDEGAGKSLQA